MALPALDAGWVSIGHLAPPCYLFMFFFVFELLEEHIGHRQHLGIYSFLTSFFIVVLHCAFCSCHDSATVSEVGKPSKPSDGVGLFSAVNTNLRGQRLTAMKYHILQSRVGRTRLLDGLHIDSVPQALVPMKATVWYGKITPK